MSDDLTTRLRALAAEPESWRTKTAAEAADRIAQLEKENRQLAKMVKDWADLKLEIATPEDIGMVSCAPTVAGSQFDKLWRFPDEQ